MEKIFLVFGSGGHQKQMIILASSLEKKYEIVAVLTKQDFVKQEILERYRSCYVILPRISDEGYLRYFIKSALCFMQSLLHVIREKPKAIISCGPSTAVPTMYAGKLLGSKVIFIESWSKINTKSISGKLVYPIADLFIIQWEEMLGLYPDGTYKGRFSA